MYTFICLKTVNGYGFTCCTTNPVKETL